MWKSTARFEISTFPHFHISKSHRGLTMRGRLLLTFILAALVYPAALYAQASPPESDAVAPAHVAHVEGTASLEREGRAENSPLNMPLLSGDRLRTADGRLEVLFADGTTLHLDNRSTIDVQSDELVRLTDGRLRLNIPGALDRGRDRRLTDGMVSYRIDSPAGSARITQPGEYRIAVLRRETEIQLEVAVVRGAAEVFTDQGTTSVRAGERAYASAGLAPSFAYAYNSATWDAFDRWSEARRDVRLGVSSQYLPSDMQAYAPVLDGDWRYTQDYGYAWYPRVTAEWRPYYYGRWASYPRYGWTWVGAERFAWPTHHYGRWGLSAGVWFWIPSSHWAPAYVSWAYAPGYVSWCPLGFNNRPIVAIDLFAVGPDYYSPWRAWTAVSYSHFGSRDYYVNQRAVNWDRMDRGGRPHFEPRTSAPGFSRDIAVPRNSTPIRWAGRPVDGTQDRTAGSRVSGATTGSPNHPARDIAVPRYVNRGDEIIRSQFASPAPRPVSPGTLLPNRDGGARAETRTMPVGPARPARPEAAPSDRRPGTQAFDRTPGWSTDPAQGSTRAYDRPGPGYQRVDPTRSSGTPRAEPRGDSAQGRLYQPRAESPSYQPPVFRGYESPAHQTYQPAQPRGYEPRARPSNEPPAASAPPLREAAPRDRDQAAPRSYDRPAPQRQPERAPERAAPQERSAPPDRPGGAPARPRGGRP
jgi:hypothetical protein